MIGSDAAQLGVVPIQQALRMAQDEGLDLVEIAATARPPVCKIMDYGKFKYEASKKRQEAKKHQTVIHVKEIKLRPATDQHDLETKLKHIRRFLEEGDKVKITIRFRGREMAHKDLGYDKLKKIIECVADVAKIEQDPKFENKTLFAVVSPIGKPSKKSGKPGVKNAKVKDQPRSPETV